MVGHILRHPSLAYLITEGRVEYKHYKGRQGLEYIKQIVEEVGYRNYIIYYFTTEISFTT